MREVVVNEVIVIDVDCNAALNPKKKLIPLHQARYIGRKAGRKKRFDFMDIYDLVYIDRTLHNNTRKHSGSCFNDTQRSRLCGFFFLLVSEQLVPDIAATDITPGIVRIIHLYVLLLKPTLSQETAHFGSSTTYFFVVQCLLIW